MNKSRSLVIRAKHTPGPWWYVEGVVLPDGDTYVDNGVRCARPNMDAVAQLVRNPADGELIAATPQLVESLVGILAALEKHGHVAATRVDEARAILKAAGVQA